MTATKVLLWFAMFATSAHASVIAYQNTTKDLGAGINFQANGLEEAGDQVTLIPGTHLLTQVLIEVFNSGFDVGTDATLILYEVTGNALGSLITTVTLPSVTFPEAASTLLAFDFSQFPVPNEMVWTLVFADSSGLELNLFDPPAVGYSDPTTAWFRTPAGTLDLDVFDPGPGGNYERNFNATFLVADTQSAGVPEPSTLLLTGAALVLIWRRK